MKGTGELVINKESLIEIIQLYFQGHLRQLGKIKDVLFTPTTIRIIYDADDPDKDNWIDISSIDDICRGYRIFLNQNTGKKKDVKIRE